MKRNAIKMKGNAQRKKKERALKEGKNGAQQQGKRNAIRMKMKKIKWKNKILTKKKKLWKGR